MFNIDIRHANNKKKIYNSTNHFSKMFTTIYLHGALGRKFGKEWKLDVSTVKEAIRAIDINLKGKLIEYWFTKGRDKKYRIKLEDYSLSDEKEILGPIGKTKNIHILPITKGSKSGVGKIFAAIAIAVVTYYTGQYGTAAGWGKTTLDIVANTGYGLSISLALGGIVQLLTPVPNFNQDSGNDNASTIFAGNSTMQTQGGSVAVVYGQMIIAPMPIAVSISNSDTKITTDIDYSDVEVEYLDGGGVQYRTISKN